MPISANSYEPEPDSAAGGTVAGVPPVASLERYLAAAGANAIPWRCGAQNIRIHRARDYHLYDRNGRRFVDFWQANGRALFTHRPPGFGRTVKDQLERGLWVPVSDRWSHRAQRQVFRTMEELDLGAPRSVRFFRTAELRLLIDRGAPGNGGAVWTAGATGDAVNVRAAGNTGDAGNTELAGQEPRGPTLSVAVWRPFIQSPGLATDGPADLLVLAVPVLLPDAPVPVVSLTAQGREELEQIPGGRDSIWNFVPYQWAALVHVLSSLGHKIRTQTEPRLEQARRLEVPPGFLRNGIYMNAAIPINTEDWCRRVQRALDLGIVLPGCRQAPIVVPASFGEYEIRQWKQLCDEWR